MDAPNECDRRRGSRRATAGREIRQIGAVRGDRGRRETALHAQMQQEVIDRGAKAIRGGVIDYKDVATLRKFISERGKIRARRITGVSVQEQRLIATAVKNAREMALLPYYSSAR